MSDVEIPIEYIGRKGDGIGEWQGQPVFVARALPGEMALVTLEQREIGWIGHLRGIAQPSPERVASPCPHYESCGSCSLQHWSVESYRKWKAGRALEALERAGVQPLEVKPPVFIEAATRRRATFAAFKQHHEFRLGYHRMRTHDITDIPDCLVLEPRLQKTANALRPHLMKILTDSRPADVSLQDTGAAFDVIITGPVGPRHVPGSMERDLMKTMAEECGLARVSWRAKDYDVPQVQVQLGPVIKKCGPLRVELPPGAFMQPSKEGEAALVEAVLAGLPKGFKGRVAELFAGCGTFTGPLLQKARVHAVESDPSAVEALQKCAKGRSDLDVARRDLFDSPLGAQELEKFGAVVLDPPRSGAKAQAEQLARSKVPVIIYVSCNPSTFARDAALLKAGGYKLASIQTIDQFLWSAHIELVGIFRR